MVNPVYVVDVARTPFGKFNGALAGVRPDDLAAAVLRGLAERHPLATVRTRIRPHTVRTISSRGSA